MPVSCSIFFLIPWLSGGLRRTLYGILFQLFPELSGPDPALKALILQTALVFPRTPVHTS